VYNNRWTQDLRTNLNTNLGGQQHLANLGNGLLNRDEGGAPRGAPREADRMPDSAINPDADLSDPELLEMLENRLRKAGKPVDHDYEDPEELLARRRHGRNLLSQDFDDDDDVRRVIENGTDAELQQILGIDNRIVINYLADNQPYRRIARTSGGGFCCSAFKVYNHHTAMTAAHCVYDSGGWKTRHQLWFGSGQNRPARFPWLAGQGTPLPAVGTGCYARVVPGCWASSTSGTACDFAIYVLRGRYGAYCSFSDYNVGYYGYRSMTGSGISGYVAGYPVTNGNCQYGDLCYRYKSNGWRSGTSQKYYIDTDGCQSGSPYANNANGGQMYGVHKGMPSSSYNWASAYRNSMYNFMVSNYGY